MTRDEQLANFGLAVWSGVSARVSCGEMSEEDVDLMELAVACDLCVYELYDPARHGEMEHEPGEDMIYWWGVR